MTGVLRNLKDIIHPLIQVVVPIEQRIVRTTKTPKPDNNSRDSTQTTLTIMPITVTDCSLSRVDLINCVRGAVGIPICTSLLHYRGGVHGLQLVRMFSERWSASPRSSLTLLHLHGGDVKPIRGMPSNMTMQWPDTWVVGIILKHHITPRLQHLHITTLRVIRVGYPTVPSSHTFSKDVEAVAMHMHWMRRGTLVIQNESDATITAEIVHVPLRIIRVGCITLCGEQQDGLVVIRTERGAIHEP